MKLYCTSCGHAIEAANVSSGTLMICPSCQSEIVVPQRKKTRLPEIWLSPTTDSKSSKPGPVWGRVFRQFFLLGLIGCFVVGAATAIVVLLSSELGEIQAKILLTTFSLGVYSVTGLCCALLGDRRPSGRFWKLGIAASIAGALFAILTSWELVTGWKILVKGRILFLIVALAFAHSALLLMIHPTHRSVRLLRSITLGVIALVAALLVSITLVPDTFFHAWVLLGVLGVLDVLGTVATPVFHLATRKPRPG
jgi:DNA-directed RNA polymerase subunit RPC12/RpoP